jgi:hypothetical protein
MQYFLIYVESSLEPGASFNIIYSTLVKLQNSGFVIRIDFHW